MSGGAFDALVLPDLVAAGYDRTFSEIGSAAWSADWTEPASGLRLGIRRPVTAKVTAAAIEVRGAEVRLVEGAGFDPGGIGKGLAADLALDDLLSAGAAGAC